MVSLVHPGKSRRIGWGEACLLPLLLSEEILRTPGGPRGWVHTVAARRARATPAQGTETPRASFGQ